MGLRRVRPPPRSTGRGGTARRAGRPLRSPRWRRSRRARSRPSAKARTASRREGADRPGRQVLVLHADVRAGGPPTGPARPACRRGGRAMGPEGAERPMTGPSVAACVEYASGAGRLDSSAEAYSTQAATAAPPSVASATSRSPSGTTSTASPDRAAADSTTSASAPSGSPSVSAAASAAAEGLVLGGGHACAAVREWARAADADADSATIIRKGASSRPPYRPPGDARVVRFAGQQHAQYGGVDAQPGLVQGARAFRGERQGQGDGRVDGVPLGGAEGGGGADGERGAGPAGRCRGVEFDAVGVLGGVPGARLRRRRRGPARGARAAAPRPP